MSFDNIFHGAPTVPVPSAAPALGVDVVNNALYIGSGSAWNPVGATGTVTAPVALTANKIPKATGAATVANSSITDNGTIVSTAEEVDIGAAGTATGVLGLLGTTSGKISIKPQAVAGTWEFDLPIAAGSAGQLLTSQGGAGTACTWTTGLTAPVALTSGVVPKATGAGTVANGTLADNGTTVVSTVPFIVPGGSGANGLTGLQFAGGASFYRNSTSVSAWCDDISLPTWGMGEDATATVPAAATTSAGTIGWTNITTSTVPQLTDTAFSRTAGGKIALGNGTPGDASGTLNLSRINVSTIDTNSGSMTIATGDAFSSIDLSPNGIGAMSIQANGTSVRFTTKVDVYKNINLVDSGLISGVGHLDLAAQVAPISATTVFTPTTTGRVRISVYEKVTTAGTTSILGGASGTVLTYTDGTDSVAQSITMSLTSQAGTVGLTNAGNTTTTSLYGDAYIYALTGVPIQVAVGYTSTGTAMAYVLRATCGMI